MITLDFSKCKTPEDVQKVYDSKNSELDNIPKPWTIINLDGLDDKWSLTSHENCCDCGVNFEDNDECPRRFWKDPESPNCTELALCEICAKKRMGPNTKEE